MRTHQYKQYLKGEADKETGKFESCTYVTSAEKSDLRVKKFVLRYREKKEKIPIFVDSQFVMEICSTTPRNIRFDQIAFSYIQ